MSEKQIELNNNRKKQLGHFLEAMPDLAKLLGAQMNEAYKDGAIDGKTKRLMAMAVALDLGATREDFLETIAVVISMRGTTGVAESLRVIQLLDELGKL